jgi:hypothetical protein
MAVQWKDKKIDEVKLHLQRLDKAIGVDAKGQVSMPIQLAFGHGFETGAAIIAACATFSDETPEREQVAIAEQAIADSKKAGSLELRDVLSHMQRRERAYLKRPKEPYVLLSTLSLAYYEKLGLLRPSGATITFSRSVPKRFKIPDRVKTSYLYRERLPTNYTRVRTRVSARDILTATDTAIDQLDFVRAVWNFFFNYGQWRLSLDGGTTRISINSIVYGPIHTLHHPDGTSATDVYWREPSFVEPVPAPHDVKQRYDELKSFERSLRGNVKKSAAKRELLNCLLRYVRALDERDLTSSFLKLWSLLEDLTATSTYEKTIRRATFMLKDREYHESVLKYLRTWRNRIVHEGDYTHESERFAYLLKQYVEHLLFFLIEHPKTFASLDEFGSFLQLPADPNVLKVRIGHHQLAHDIYFK